MPGDHADIPFIEARTQSGGPAYTLGRPDGPPLWVVIHDMEFPERDDAAEWTANYFHTGAGGRSVSSHYTADNTSIVQCVLLRDSAWTVGNRAGNYRGINWELAGYASQTREQWLDPYGRAMLERVAAIMRRDMDEYAIPAQLLTDVQVGARIKGVTSHAQLGRVFGGTDHTDPGANFPWDHLISLLGADMALSDRDAQALIWRAEALIKNLPTVAGGPTKGEPNQLHAKLEQLQALLEAPDAGGGATVTQIEELLNRTVSNFTVAGSSVLAVRPPAPGSGS